MNNKLFVTTRGGRGVNDIPMPTPETLAIKLRDSLRVFCLCTNKKGDLVVDEVETREAVAPAKEYRTIVIAGAEAGVAVLDPLPPEPESEPEPVEERE